MARRKRKGAGDITEAKARTQAVNPLRSALFDPHAIAWQVQGMRQRQAALSFKTLRRMALVCNPVAAIVVTRQNQIANFAKRPEYDGDLGFRIRMKDRDGAPGPATKKVIRQLEDFILATGMGPDPDGKKRPGFDAYLRAGVRDSLTLDALATELRPAANGSLFDFWGMDAATILLAAPSYQAGSANGSILSSREGYVGQGYGGIVQPEGERITYVQNLDNMPFAEFTESELAYWIRNPRTDLESNGYGFSELESMIETITSFLNSMQYNARYFTHGNIPEGVLSISGQYNDEDIEAFIRYWNGMVAGVGNSHRVPVFGVKDGKGINWTPMKQGNKEMEYHQWMDFLTGWVCAIYATDREEIGLDSRSAGSPGGLGSADNEGTLQHSISKGLRPILTRFASGINEDIIPKVTGAEEFEFYWTGLTPNQESQRVDLATKFLQAGIKTPNEVRSEFDMEAVGEDELWGDAPVNTVAYQAWSLGKQAELQANAPEQDDAGQPGAAGQPGLPKVNADGTEEDDSDGAQDDEGFGDE